MTTTVGLIIGAEVPPGLHALVHELAHQHRIVYAPGFPGPLDGCVLYRSPLAPADGVPTAQWLETEADAAAVLPGVSVVVSAHPPLLAAVEDDVTGLLMPPEVAEVGDARPVLPFTRELIRRARGLPATVVAELRGGRVWWDGADVAAELAGTVLGTASAVICDKAAAVLALAFGAPTVVDSGTAVWLGAEDGTHVRVGLDIDSRRQIAAELAADPIAAARLSRAGRQLFEAMWSTSHAARRLAHVLVPPVLPHDRRAQELDALETPRAAVIRSRSGMMLSGLPARSHQPGLQQPGSQGAS